MMKVGFYALTKLASKILLSLVKIIPIFGEKKAEPIALKMNILR